MFLVRMSYVLPATIGRTPTPLGWIDGRRASILQEADPVGQGLSGGGDVAVRVGAPEARRRRRTNTVQLYARVDESAWEEICYYGHTSLCPYENKTREYPVRHPEFIYGPDATNINGYFGLIKCTVPPPEGLFHPVLPYRTHEKLTLPLCRRCVEENVDRPLLDKVCEFHHMEEERVLVGSWCTPALQKAVDKGYLIVYIHEVWLFPRTRVGFFKDYVNTWLKIKEEASGWPVGCNTETKKQEHHRRYEQWEGIQLEYGKMEKNPGLRPLAKMTLNSM